MFFVANSYIKMLAALFPEIERGIRNLKKMLKRRVSETDEGMQMRSKYWSYFIWTMAENWVLVIQFGTG